MSGKETVLVTGASAGIGAELARCFATDGADLVLLARRADRLESVAGELRARHRVEVTVLPADLARPGEAERIQGELKARALEVDVMVNTAGFGARGRFVDLDHQRQLDMIQLNLTSLVDLTWRLLPAMVERRRGGVLNVGSQAGFLAGPRMAVYYATKAFVLSFTEALAEELRGSGVTATVLAPGPVNTEFAEVAGMKDARMFRLAAADARGTAEAGHRAFRRGDVIVIPEVAGRLGIQALRLAPRGLVRRVVNALQGS
ncbi:MAG: SDR family oxidoreductase [Geminicoccaceae bacterium]|nr:SDR family oxidoreductase [Geminicoccaceae bacterium]